MTTDDPRDTDASEVQGPDPQLNLAARLVSIEALLRDQARLLQKSRRMSVRDAVLPLVSVLVGGLIAFVSTWSVAQLQLEAAANESSRVARAEAYDAYLTAANGYAVAAQQRLESCRPGTDLALTATQPCAPSQAVYQNARYEYSVAWQDLRLVGTARAIAVADWISTLLPTTDVGFNGNPVDATEPLGLAQSGLMSSFRDVQRCDVAAQLPEDCDELLSRVDELLESLELLH